MDTMTKKFMAWVQTPAGLVFMRMFGTVLKSLFVAGMTAFPLVFKVTGLEHVNPETVSANAFMVATTVVGVFSYFQSRHTNKRIKNALDTPCPKPVVVQTQKEGDAK